MTNNHSIDEMSESNHFTEFEIVCADGTKGFVRSWGGSVKLAPPEFDEDEPDEEDLLMEMQEKEAEEEAYLMDLFEREQEEEAYLMDLFERQQEEALRDLFERYQSGDVTEEEAEFVERRLNRV